jgi:hypothetical protein
MPATYDFIATTTLGSNQSSVVFSSIPATYTDLRMVCQVTSNVDGRDLIIQFNSDTGANYSYTAMQGNGSTINQNQVNNSSNPRVSGQSNYLSSTVRKFFEIDIMRYSNTSVNKTCLFRGSGDTGTSVDNYPTISNCVTTWRNTAAINRVEVFPQSTYAFTTNSTFSLYGITAA